MANLKASWTLESAMNMKIDDEAERVLAEEIRKEIDEAVLRQLVDSMCEQDEKYCSCQINSEHNDVEVIKWLTENRIDWKRGSKYWWFINAEDMTLFLLKWR